MLLLGGAVVLVPHGHLLAPDAFPGFALGAALLLAGFTGGLALRAPSANVFWLGAAGARLVLWPMEAGDDLWRYLWEGLVQVHGHSPYLQPPADPALHELRPDWWGWINHPTQTAIYPPPLLLLFAGLSALQPAPWLFKAVFIAADLVLCHLLLRRFGPRGALFYAWNPVALYGIAGGGHFESLLLLPTVAAWLLEPARGNDPPAGRRRLAQAVLLGLGLGAKWVTLPLVGWLAWRECRLPGPPVRRAGRAALVAALALLPVAVAALVFILRFGELGPLFPAEFVARARGGDFGPWLLHHLAGWPVDDNTGPSRLLGLAAAGVIFLAPNLGAALVAWNALYLLLHPSVHFWYFIAVLPWACGDRHRAALALTFSGWLYFVLPWRNASGHGWSWTALERLGLWLPFVAGWLWEWLRHRRRPVNSSTRASP